MIVSRRWLVMRLEAPLLAFGGVTIDQVGITSDFPAASMLTGLLANSLGWDRTDWQAHQSLQDRLVFAARRDRENPTGILTDTQNAQLGANDEGWTTRGQPEGRTGASYKAPHRRQRDYHADGCVTVVVTLEPAKGGPDLDSIASALDRPARPIFFGRKNCLPSARLLVGEIMASSGYEALSRPKPVEGTVSRLRALWPQDEGPNEGSAVHRIIALPDIRNWKTGLHGGTRFVVEGTVVAGEQEA